MSLPDHIGLEGKFDRHRHLRVLRAGDSRLLAPISEMWCKAACSQPLMQGKLHIPHEYQNMRVRTRLRHNPAAGGLTAGDLDETTIQSPQYSSGRPEY